MYEFGRGVSKDATEAWKLYRTSAEQGFPPAQFLLGSRAEREENIQVASEWYEKAAKQEYLPAIVPLGDLYYYGKLERDHKIAAKWFQIAAQKGSEKAMLQLGELYSYNRGDVFQNHAESAKWFRLAAEKGNAQAQYQLGLLLLDGDGIAHDPAQARQWLDQAAAQGHSKAAIKLLSLQGPGNSGFESLSREQLENLAASGAGPALLALAVDYEEGRHGERDSYSAAGLYCHILTLNSILDKELATNIFEASHRLVGLYATGTIQPRPIAPGGAQSSKGFPDYYSFVAPKSPVELSGFLQQRQTAINRPEDQLRVGEMFYAGKIVPEDSQEAVNWFLKAAKAGNPEAINRIGELWAAGLDGTPDHKEAARWFRRAAGKGSPNAQLNIGRAFEKGEGVEQDLVQSWIWFKAAADHGAKPAIAEIERVQAQLTPEQLQRAKNSGLK